MVPFTFLKMCGYKALQREDWLTRIVGVEVQFASLLFPFSYLGLVCLQIQIQPLQQGLWRLPGAEQLPGRAPSLLGALPLETRTAGPVIKT